MRENFKKLINHTNCRPMVDLGGCPQAYLTANQEERLKVFLGFETEKEKELLPFGQSYNIDERILKEYDIDFRGVGYILTPPNSHYRSISSDRYIDEWGIERKFTGLYWDIVKMPLKEASYDDIKAYQFPEPKSIKEADINKIKQSAEYLYNNTDYIICASHPVYGIFELGCWMFGFDDFLLKMALEPESVELFFQRVLEYQKEVNQIYYSAIGKYIHITTSGDDFATQNSTFVSQGMFNSQIAPYFKKRICDVKNYTQAKFLHHSCGNVFSLIPSLIDCGVDILNPIQPCSKEMNPENLKNSFGKDIIFHGGFDTQDLLLNGTKEQIKLGVSTLFSQLHKNGGYIFATAHIIQDDIPTQNIDTLFRAANDFKKQY